MFHGLFLIIWEGIFGSEKKTVMKESEKKCNDYDFKKNVCLFLKRLLLLSVYTLVSPPFVELYVRKVDHWVIPSFFSNIRNIGNSDHF